LHDSIAKVQLGELGVAIAIFGKLGHKEFVACAGESMLGHGRGQLDVAVVAEFAAGNSLVLCKSKTTSVLE
jgi:hypothetical protein